MKRLMFYSHDTYGLGNIRRALSICKSLLQTDRDYSILIISGSPMIHGFHIPKGADYIKLPCLSRTERDGYQSKFLDECMKRVIQLRSDMILCATENFRPDLIIVDKKPFGVQRELEPTLSFLHHCQPQTKAVLLLRDILDGPQATQRVWQKEGYFQAIRKFYEAVLVVGWEHIFDLCHEYEFPSDIKGKVQYCGYIQREAGRKSRAAMRNELGLGFDDRLALLTVGGGEDGGRILQNYMTGIRRLNKITNVKSLILTGPEMPDAQRQAFRQTAMRYPRVRLMEFTDDLMSHMDAADVVISMGGYNTICEVLTLRKPAIVIPRVRPVEEQWIRAERMSKLGLFTTIHPDELTPQRLTTAVAEKLEEGRRYSSVFDQMDLGALPRISKYIASLMQQPRHINLRPHGSPLVLPSMNASAQLTYPEFRN